LQSSGKVKLRFALAVAALVTVALPLPALQRIDTTATGVQRQPATRRDSLTVRDQASRAPISPGRAFLGSFLVPGLSQSILGRKTGVAIFATIEVTGWAMLFRSMNDLSRAKRFARSDSVVLEYRIDQNTGLVERDPDTGDPLVLTYEPDVYAEGLISARRQHVEDWAAIIVFNHLLAGADALVAAHLWNAGAQLRIEARPRGAAIVGKISW
jgi:hypothetical protein